MVLLALASTAEAQDAQFVGEGLRQAGPEAAFFQGFGPFRKAVGDRVMTVEQEREWVRIAAEHPRTRDAQRRSFQDLPELLAQVVTRSRFPRKVQRFRQRNPAQYRAQLAEFEALLDELLVREKALRRTLREVGATQAGPITVSVSLPDMTACDHAAAKGLEDFDELLRLTFDCRFSSTAVSYLREREGRVARLRRTDGATTDRLIRAVLRAHDARVSERPIPLARGSVALLDAAVDSSRRNLNPTQLGLVAVALRRIREIPVDPRGGVDLSAERTALRRVSDLACAQAVELAAANPNDDAIHNLARDLTNQRDAFDMYEDPRGAVAFYRGLLVIHDWQTSVSSRSEGRPDAAAVTAQIRPLLREARVLATLASRERGPAREQLLRAAGTVLMVAMIDAPEQAWRRAAELFAELPGDRRYLAPYARRVLGHHLLERLGSGALTEAKILATGFDLGIAHRHGLDSNETPDNPYVELTHSELDIDVPMTTIALDVLAFANALAADPESDTAFTTPVAIARHVLAFTLADYGHIPAGDVRKSVGHAVRRAGFQDFAAALEGGAVREELKVPDSVYRQAEDLQARFREYRETCRDYLLLDARAKYDQVRTQLWLGEVFDARAGEHFVRLEQAWGRTLPEARSGPGHYTARERPVDVLAPKRALHARGTHLRTLVQPYDFVPVSPERLRVGADAIAALHNSCEGRR
jgi:hypothetical protein